MKKILIILLLLSTFAPALAIADVPNCTGTNAASDSRCAPVGGQNLTYTPLEPIPGVTTGANGSAIDFPTLLGNIYRIAIIIGALFSVLMLTLSGIRYMLSDVVTDKEKALKRIRACLWGLLLIAISWLILNTINPQLVTFSLNPQGATVNYVPPPTNGTVTNPVTSNGNALALTAEEQQNIQNNTNNPDSQTCNDTRTALTNPSLRTRFGRLFGLDSTAQQDQILRAYADSCAAKGL